MGLALAELELLLRAHKLDRTLPSNRPAVPDAAVPAGLDALDARLGGGVPRGQLSELAGPCSSGRTSLACRLIAASTARGEIAALVDTLDTFDPASGAAAGIDLARLLWIRGHAFGRPAARGGWRPGPAAAVDRAIKALNLVLQAGGFGLVVLDLADVPSTVVRRLPFTTWLRLHRTIEGSETACLLLGAAPIARSPGGVTIVLGAGPADAAPATACREGDAGIWMGASDRGRLLCGLTTTARFIRARLRGREEEALRLQFTTREGRPHWPS
jgi:hypothetical protein